jgi:hypothetical protein
MNNNFSFETKNDFQINEYGLLIYDTLNLGDEIQSIAAKNFLPNVNITINRDTLELNKKPINVAKTIYNGWFDGRYSQFPPPKSIYPLFVSFHINEVDHSQDSLYNYLDNKYDQSILKNENIEYFKKYQPIGCRDLYTVQKFQEKGIESYFSGCMTLTLQSNLVNNRNNKILVVDSHILCKKLFEQIIPSSIRKTCQYEIQGLSLGHKLTNEQKFEEAQKLLDKIAQAKCVITSRLHTALPCLAFGTPVIFITDDKKDIRFEGYHEFIHFLSHGDTLNIDIHNFQNKNQDKLEKLISNLRNRVKKWIADPISMRGNSIISVCMNRNDNLNNALDSWIDAKPNEIILVDWNSKISIKPIVEERKNKAKLSGVELKLITIKNTNKWVLSKSFNLAARFCKYSNILKLDADNIIKPDFFYYHNLENNIFFAGDWRAARNRNEFHLNGVIYLTKKDFSLVNGYNEYITTYGYDDCDLYSRLEKRGISRQLINLDKIEHIEHTHFSRVENQIVKRLDIEIEKNRLISEKIHWDRSKELSKFKFSNLELTYKTEEITEIVGELMWSEELDIQIFKECYEKAVKNREYVLKNQKKRLYIDVQNGIGNRLRALASAYILAKESNRELVVIWLPNNHCDCKFTDLFKINFVLHGIKIVQNLDDFGVLNININIKNTEIIHIGEDNNIDVYDYSVKKNMYIDLNTNKDIFIRSACILNNEKTNWYKECTFLRTLEIHEELAKKLFQHSLDFSIYSLIGVHIRMGQNMSTYDYEKIDHYSETAKESITKWRSKSHWKNFAEYMKILIKSTPEQKFFVSCDNKDTYLELLKEFPIGTIYYLNRDVDDRSLEQIKYALLDVYLLSRTKYILGSNWSSFTELVLRLGNNNAKYAGIDF